MIIRIRLNWSESYYANLLSFCKATIGSFKALCFKHCVSSYMAKMLYIAEKTA